MEIIKLDTKNAPEAIGPYSQGIQAGGFIFLSGQIPINPSSGDIEGQDIEEQTIQVFENIKAVLNEAGADFSNVVKTTVFLKDLSSFGTFNKIYAGYFKQPFPARVCVEVSKLPKDALVEIDIIAIK